MEILMLIIGVVVGGAIGWFAASARTQQATKETVAAAGRAAAEKTAAEARLTTLESQLTDQATQFEAQQTRERELMKMQMEQVRQDAEQQRVRDQDQFVQRLNDLRKESDAQLSRLTEQSRKQLEHERQEATKRIEEVKEDHKKLSDDFEALAAKILQNTSKSLLEQADERFKRAHERSDAELAKREEAVKQLVEPLKKSLVDVKTEVTNAEKSRIKANAELAEQVTQMRSASDLLRNETSQLVTALRAPQVRGRWGELQLRRVVEAAGMLHRVDFEEQFTFETDEGTLRPDMVVNLPGEKQVIVDAKTPFAGYLEAMEAADDKERSARLKAHARHVGNHINELGAKSYWEQLPNTPEFVVMFIPAETFLQAALEEDPSLLEQAFEKNIVLATPTTLVALLRTVAYTWRQEQLAGEAQQVFTVGRELHKRLGTLGGHLKKLSTRINSVVTAFNEFNSSLDRNVVTQAKRFSELQGIESPLESPPPLEVLAVPAHKPELYAEVGTEEALAITED